MAAESVVSRGTPCSVAAQRILIPSLKERGIASAADLRNLPPERHVTVAGVVVIRQRPMTAKGFMFLTMEDETGFSNVVVKPRMLKRFRRVLVHSQALIVNGKLEKRDGVVNVIGGCFTPLQINDKDIHLKSRNFR